MSEQNNSRSGLQKAADLAYAARAAHRILQAAAVSGAYGAGIAAVKEALPRLVKVSALILIALLLIPLVIFSALPNIFFGYASSDTEVVVQMTEQAMSLGGVYLSLEDFEKTYIDAVVTEISAEYEASGTVIDRIVISNSMKEEDLLWLIAIHSVDLEQDLSAMTKALVQDLCKSSMHNWYSLVKSHNYAKLSQKSYHKRGIYYDVSVFTVGRPDRNRSFRYAE